MSAVVARPPERLAVESGNGERRPFRLQPLYRASGAENPTELARWLWVDRKQLERLGDVRAYAAAGRRAGPRPDGWEDDGRECGQGPAEPVPRGPHPR
jgi:hypothetical protein